MGKAGGEKIKTLTFLLLPFLFGFTFDKADKIMIGAGLSLTLVDAYQTKRILESDEFTETEPMIKSKGDILPVMLVTDSIVIITSKFLPGKGRKWLLGFWIGCKGVAIKHNYDLGVR